MTSSVLRRNAGGLSWSHYSSGHASSLDAAALSHLEARELRMRGLDYKSDRPLRAGGAAPDLANVIFKTVRQVDPRPCAPRRNRIAQRLARWPRSISARGAAPFARRRRSRRRRGRESCRRSRRTPGRGAPRLGVEAAHSPKQGVPLLWRRFRINNRHHLVVVSVCRQRIELAGAATGAIATGVFPALQGPSDDGHLALHGFRPVNAPVHS